MMLPPDAWSYVVGLFEGRGWVTTQKRKGRQTEYVNLGIAMQDHEPLLAVQDFLGGGRVNGPYKRTGGGVVAPGNYEQRYVLMLTRREDIDPFLKRIYGHLSPRRREAVMMAMARDTRGPWEEPA
jgi:hypothetical protein